LQKRDSSTPHQKFSPIISSCPGSAEAGQLLSPYLLHINWRRFVPQCGTEHWPRRTHKFQPVDARIFVSQRLASAIRGLTSMIERGASDPISWAHIVILKSSFLMGSHCWASQQKVSQNSRPGGNRSTNDPHPVPLPKGEGTRKVAPYGSLYLMERVWVRAEKPHDNFNRATI